MDIIHTLTSVIRLWQDENLAWSHVAPAFISGKRSHSSTIVPFGGSVRNRRRAQSEQCLGDGRRREPSSQYLGPAYLYINSELAVVNVR